MGNKIFIENYVIPEKSDKYLSDFSLLNFVSTDFLKITIIPKPHCTEWNCHNNVLQYVSLYGGKRILGYYFIKEIETNKIIAIKHSVWKNTYDKIIDITPFSDNRNYNIFLQYDSAIESYIIG